MRERRLKAEVMPIIKADVHTPIFCFPKLTSVGSLTYKNKISNMETLSFTFGVLSVVAVIFVAAIVLGIVKVLKQQKQINSIQSEIERVWQYNSQLSQEIHQRISSHQESVIRSIDETNQRIGHTEAELYRHVDTNVEDVQRRIDITRSDLNSYIDSRIDKLSANTKQLIKG